MAAVNSRATVDNKRMDRKLDNEISFQLTPFTNIHSHFLTFNFNCIYPCDVLSSVPSFNYKVYICQKNYIGYSIISNQGFKLEHLSTGWV